MDLHCVKLSEKNRFKDSGLAIKCLQALHVTMAQHSRDYAITVSESSSNAQVKVGHQIQTKCFFKKKKQLNFARKFAKCSSQKIRVNARK